MATLTRITGYLYDPKGQVLTKGLLNLTLQQDMVSIDGTKVAPFSVSVDLSKMTPVGNVDVSVYATVGASPAGLAYFVYFDPDPSDASKPVRSKVGYWDNYWAVPNAASVTIGSFTQALRGQPSANYLPVGGSVGKLAGTTAPSAGASQGYLILEINGVQRKIPYYAL